MKDKEFWISIAKGAAVAAIGAVTTFVLTSVVPVLQDSGDPTKLLIATVLAVLANIGRKSLGL